MIENHSKSLMFHMPLWVKDELDPLFWSSGATYAVWKDLEVINHTVYFFPHCSGMAVLLTEHIVSTEGTALN